MAAPDNQPRPPALRVPEVFIKFVVTDPERRTQREYKIRDILEREKVKNPLDARYGLFYLPLLN
jgi:hypothetical protein